MGTAPGLLGVLARFATALILTEQQPDTDDDLDPPLLDPPDLDLAGGRHASGRPTTAGSRALKGLPTDPGCG